MRSPLLVIEMRLSLIMVLSTATFAALFSPPVVTYKTPQAEPSVNGKGAQIIGGGLPVGNGETTAYVFPITPGTVYDLENTPQIHIL